MKRLVLALPFALLLLAAGCVPAQPRQDGHDTPPAKLQALVPDGAELLGVARTESSGVTRWVATYRVSETSQTVALATRVAAIQMDLSLLEERALSNGVQLVFGRNGNPEVAATITGGRSVLFVLEYEEAVAGRRR